MGKEKIIEKTGEVILNKTNMILQYAPIFIGLVCLVICYLLFKKIQSLSSLNSSIENIEKQFTGFVKEQSEINVINAKRFNALIAQMNQVSYVIQNNSVREINTVNSQMSPDKSQGPQQGQPQGQPQEPSQVPSHEQKQVPPQGQPQVPQGQPQRELMPTSVIQTNFPINSGHSTLPTPVSTTNRKEKENNVENFHTNVKETTKSGSKKVIDLQGLKEEVLIEEASSDDEE